MKRNIKVERFVKKKRNGRKERDGMGGTND